MPDVETAKTAAHPGAGQDRAGQAGQQPAAGKGPDESAQYQAAFRAGWLTAQLCGPVLDRGGGSAGHHLPSVSELPLDKRVDLSTRELENALAAAAAGIEYRVPMDAVRQVERSGEWHQAFKDALARLHRLLLVEFTAKDPHLGRAYALGRSLSDTAWLPADLQTLQRQFGPYRVAELDGWLSDLSALLGHDPVTAVRRSLRTWADWAASPFIGRRKLRWDRDGVSTELALRRQGATWRDLLSGERDPASLLSAEAYVQAAGVSVRRVGFLARQVLAHFWYAVVLLLAVAGGLAYVSVAYAAGTAKFWGVFVTAVGGSGALWQGVRRGLSNVAQQAETPLWQTERDDALQVGATRLPAGATAGRLRRRVAPRKFKRPASAAIQEPPRQTETPGTANPATRAPTRIMPTSQPRNVVVTRPQSPGGPA